MSYRASAYFLHFPSAHTFARPSIRRLQGNSGIPPVLAADRKVTKANGNPIGICVLRGFGSRCGSLLQSPVEISDPTKFPCNFKR